MSIFIKGASPPENCDDCEIEWDCRYGQHIDGYKMQKGRPENCPIVEVATPHGRLIDADVMKEKIIGDYDNLRETIIEWIEVQPTIIPAEEEV